ncbi:hypothetical protein ACFOEE_05850 [Pseudoalteromonas fenneropenaei]|uniref:Uncharacterized protein n=1 Tax=Pseudoalteromonas fenneropenaei TaxID=1737459 RepID=A0ABV7CHF7_9GAMM
MKTLTTNLTPDVSWRRAAVDTEIVGARAQSFKHWLDSRHCATPLLNYNAALASNCEQMSDQKPQSDYAVITYV